MAVASSYMYMYVTLKKKDVDGMEAARPIKEQSETVLRKTNRACITFSYYVYNIIDMQ